MSDSKLRYSMEYRTDTDQVTVDRKPKDCDFFHSPLGDKDCRYEKTVFVVMRGRDNTSSRPIISYDEGKTWYWNDGDVAFGTSVSVSWIKAKP